MLQHGAAQVLGLTQKGNTVTSTVQAIGCSCMVLHSSRGCTFNTVALYLMS